VARTGARDGRGWARRVGRDGGRPCGRASGCGKRPAGRPPQRPDQPGNGPHPHGRNDRRDPRPRHRTCGQAAEPVSGSANTPGNKSVETKARNRRTRHSLGGSRLRRAPAALRTRAESTPEIPAHCRDQAHRHRETPGHCVRTRIHLARSRNAVVGKEKPPRPAEPRATPAATRGPKP
jgi:hypothetical protein